MTTKLAPHAIAEEALSKASADSTIVIVDEAHEAELRFANNTTTTNGVRHDRRVTVISFLERNDGVSVGVAARSTVDDLGELVAAAEREAGDAPSADDASPLVSDVVDAQFHDDAPTTGLSIFSSVLEGLSSGFPRAEAEGHVLAGFARHGVSTSYLASSTGLRRRHVQLDGTMELVARAADGRRSAWTGVGTPDFSDVEFEALHDRLRTRLSWAQRSVELAAGRYEVLLPPDAVADLMIPLEQAASGRDAEDGQSVFSRPGGGTRLGDTISSTPFVLASDPSYPAMQTSPFLVAHGSGTDVSAFDNGSELERTEWIKAGRLERLRYHRAGAKRTGARFTPPGENLVLGVDEPQGSLDDLIARTRRGLLVTCLWYIREVDLSTLLLTGLTRDGVYLIEDGEIVGAVNNFRFNESPVDLLARVSEVGATERALSREWNEWMSLTAMPSLRVQGFNMSSVSPAS